MPWSEVSVMDQRREFVRLALQEGANRRELCRRFGISPDVGYKWLKRWQSGDRELADQSRRPKRMPKRSAAVYSRVARTNSLPLDGDSLVELSLAHASSG